MNWLRRLVGLPPKPCDHRATRGVPPNIRTRWVSADGKSSAGTAGPVLCPKCGAIVGPMDDNYPSIRVMP